MPLNPLLVACFAVAVLVELLAPLLLALFLARRYGAGWRFWLLGVLTFVVFQGVLRIPVMLYVQTRPAVREALQEPAWFWSFLAIAALTAGLFEEGGRWLVYRFLVPPEQRHWRNGLMLGAGHGGVESIGIGLLALSGFVSYLALALLPAEALAGQPGVAEARRQFAQMPGWLPLLGAWERLGTLVIHLAFSVLVLQAFRRGPLWWWYALAAHTLVDLTTVGLLQGTKEIWGSTAALLATEGLVAVYALLALAIIRKLRDEPGEAADAVMLPTPP